MIVVVPLDRPKEGNFLNLDLDFSKEDQSFHLLSTKIYLITNN